MRHKTQVFEIELALSEKRLQKVTDGTVLDIVYPFFSNLDLVLGLWALSMSQCTSSLNTPRTFSSSLFDFLLKVRENGNLGIIFLPKQFTNTFGYLINLIPSLLNIRTKLLTH